MKKDQNYNQWLTHDIEHLRQGFHNAMITWILSKQNKLVSTDNHFCNSTQVPVGPLLFLKDTYSLIHKGNIDKIVKLPGIHPSHKMTILNIWTAWYI